MLSALRILAECARRATTLPGRMTNPIDALLTTPPLAPGEWCVARPCAQVGGVVLDQPLGTVLVMLLAVLWILAGGALWRERGPHVSRRWWAAAMAVGGVAAALAGLSYQAFGYELKCAGRDVCLWTSWFEIAYLVLQNMSVACMVVGVAYACSGTKLRRWLVGYAIANVLLHLVVTAYGLATANTSLLSFELLLLFSLPALLVAFGLNGYRFVRTRGAVDAALLGAWLGLIAVNGAYYTYLVAGITERLWDAGRGFYFSENDVLHVGMMLWLLYVVRVVAPRLADAQRGSVEASSRST